MNITVKKENIRQYMDVHGGECASSTLEITVDKSLPKRAQRNLIIHSVIENYCQSWSHDKVVSLTEDIEDALDQL